VWILAAQQTAGKGRLQRTWISPPGNVHASLLWPLESADTSATQLAFVAGCAVHDTVHALVGNRGRGILLKWPNDCLVGGAKVAGLLCEVVGDSAVIGCGINVAFAPQGLPYPATSLSAEGAPESAAAVFDVLAASMARRLSQWKSSEGFAAISRCWAQRAIGVGERVQVATGKVVMEGVFEGLGPSGEALLRNKDGLTKVWAGDFIIPSLQELRRGIA
jgi:BirA family biotin operon repressor/biotin-[acetyl-CoA-carboxylase] ligase